MWEKFLQPTLPQVSNAHVFMLCYRRTLWGVTSPHRRTATLSQEAEGGGGRGEPFAQKNLAQVVQIFTTLSRKDTKVINIDLHMK